VVRVSAHRREINGEARGRGVGAQVELKRWDKLHSRPEREIAHPFHDAYRDVFSISGRGSVVTGRIERASEGREKSRSWVRPAEKRKRDLLCKFSVSSR